MTKQSLMLMLLLTFTLGSCGKSGSGGGGSDSQESLANAEGMDVMTGTTGTNQSTTTHTTIPSSSSVPAQALSFKTNISLMNFTSAQAAKYNQAIAIVKKVVATEAFRTKVLNYKYNGIKQFADNKGRTNAQIYQSILDAAESLKPTKNNTMDLGVKLYYDSSTVIGYTNPSITYINVNTKYFNSFAANQVAGNLFHEWLHKIGYDHDSAATAKRPYSVPYAIGYMVRDLGKSFL
jgi:ssRNA-specific RNase YbeY (16S rRNA maturation enzyme)